MDELLRVGSLFAGIGGFDLGLERTGGFRTVWQVELDPYCRSVLERHFPDAVRHADVRHVGAHNLEPVDVVCGGFPCQDVSTAGTGRGLEGERSGLWSEYARIVRELRPRYVFVENVSALLARGLGTVLGDLAACGYDAEWDCLPASAFGAHHRRDRLWLLAYPQAAGREARDRDRLRTFEGPPVRPVARAAGAGVVADTDEERRDGGPGELRSLRWCESTDGSPRLGGAWPAEPDVGRVANGVPHRVDRLGALGNALIPQIPEWIGWRILDYERSCVK